MPGPLTKSRFKLAIECPTKLFYAKKENGYRNRNANNEFLEALADGGHQVGSLAKFKYDPDPLGASITVDTLDKEEALRRTRELLRQPGRVVIAEAALEYGTCFVRVDILVRDGNRIELIEVKSKSAKNSDVQSRFKGGEWRPYLYDIAFQTVVAEHNFQGFTIVPKLLLVDSEAECNVDGLHQMLRVVPNVESRTVQVTPGKTFDAAAVARLNLLREVDVTDIVAEYKAKTIDLKGVDAPHNAGLHAFMQWAAALQQQKQPFDGTVSKVCKSCEFRADAGDPARSGVHECWERAMAAGTLARTGSPADRNLALSIDIWGGGSGAVSMSEKAVNAGRAFVFDVQEDDVRPQKVAAADGFTPFERRMAQVQAFRGGAPVVLKEERLREMDGWDWPLHMIDFETSAAALPFFAGMRPYETVAFQFSHHTLHAEGNGHVRIEHATQWIRADAQGNPNIPFVRALRAALMPGGVLAGTVFRYHNHENTVLRSLRAAIVASNEADKEELIEFIDLITKPSGKEAGAIAGRKEMVDLHRLVQEGYYSKVAGGSISLKHILPAVLNDAPGVAALFSQAGVFGGPAITSQNFAAADQHVWLQPARGNDPYKTLPPINAANAPAMLMPTLRYGEEQHPGFASAHCTCPTLPAARPHPARRNAYENDQASKKSPYTNEIILPGTNCALSAASTVAIHSPAGVRIQTPSANSHQIFPSLQEVRAESGLPDQPVQHRERRVR